MSDSKKTITVDSISHPAIREKNGKEIYVLPFVKEGKLYERECSKEVFAKVESQKLAHNYRKEYVLGFKPDSEYVTRIDPRPKPDFYTGMLDLESEESNSAFNTPVLILSLIDGELNVKAKPNDTTDEVVDEILDYVYENQDQLQAQDFINDKYLITDIRQDGKYIHVDTKAR